MVFRVAERIEKPGGGIRNDIEEKRTHEAAAEKGEKRGARLEPSPQPEDRGVGGVVHELINLKTIPAFRKVIEVQRNIGERHDNQRHPPAQPVAEIKPGKEHDSIRRPTS